MKPQRKRPKEEKKRTEKNCKNNQETNNKMAMSTQLPIITLNAMD